MLDGKYDSGYAILPLGAKESDDSAPLFEAEAEELAKAYVKRLRPDLEWKGVRSQNLQNDKSGCSWVFQIENPTDSTDRIGQIYVDGTRAVTKQSWLRRAYPTQGKHLGERDLGLPVQIMVNGTFQNSQRSPVGKVDYVARRGPSQLLGVINSFDKKLVYGTFSRLESFYEPEARPLAFPRKAVISIQPVFAQ